MRFKTISIHPYSKCNLKCPFCYVEQKKERPEAFWYNLIPHISKLSPQVAVGGGEPFTNIPFIKKFAVKCKENNLICNITTNGQILMSLNNECLKETLKDVKMISISWDKYKVPTKEKAEDYFKLVQRIKTLTKCEVGCNLLVDKMNLLLVPELFRKGIDRIFALYPKNFKESSLNILKMRGLYYYLTGKYKHFYTDDTTKMILTNNSYSKWKTPCHYFKNVCSINQSGEVMGCSFDSVPLLKIKKPQDIMKLKRVKVKTRYSCPFIK